MKIKALKMKMACVGLTAGLIQSAAQATVIPIDPGTSSLDFGNPGTSSDTTAYSTSVTSTATTVTFQVTSVGVASSAFANIYISTGVKNGSPGSTVGFEIENNDVFIPGVGSPTILNPTDGIIDSIVNGADSTTVTIQIPWTFFTDDPQAMGFDKITVDNNELRLNIVQAFSDVVVGDSNGSGINFGADELGTAFYSPVPEPGTIAAGAIMLLPFGISTVRRMRKQS